MQPVAPAKNALCRHARANIHDEVVGGGISPLRSFSIATVFLVTGKDGPAVGGAIQVVARPGRRSSEDAPSLSCFQI